VDDAVVRHDPTGPRVRLTVGMVEMKVHERGSLKSGATRR